MGSGGGERGGAALVAEIVTADADPPRIVAEAEFVLLPNGNGELSMVVAAPFRGWLAPYLLDVLGNHLRDRSGLSSKKPMSNASRT